MVANSNNDSISLINTTTGAVEQTVNVNPLPGIDRRQLPERHHDAGLPPPSWSASGATTPWPSTATAAPGRRCSSRACCRPTSTRSTPSTMPPSARSSSPTTRASAPGACPRPSTRAPGPPRAPGRSPGTTPTTTPARSPSSPCRPRPNSAGYTHQVFVNNNWEHLLASTPLQRCDGRAGRHPGPAGLPVPDQARVPDRPGEPDLRPGARRHRQGQQRPRATRSSAPRSRRTRTSWPTVTACSTTSTTRARCRPTATTGWCRPTRTTTSRRSSAPSTAATRPRAATPSPTSGTGSSGTRPRRPGRPSRPSASTTTSSPQPARCPPGRSTTRTRQILEGKATGPLPVPGLGDQDLRRHPVAERHRLPPPTRPFDLDIPDQYRADIWAQSFALSEQTGQLPNLNLIWMPDDHTAGIGTGAPNPVAEVADNDLAVGRIIDTISHSSSGRARRCSWSRTTPRTASTTSTATAAPLLIASPYAKRGIVDHTYYTQLNVVKTIEQILGIAPMNQEDRAAWPMFNAFTNTPDFAPYDAVPNQIPLTQGLAASASAVHGRAARSRAGHARPAGRARVPSWRCTRTWVVWSRNGRFVRPSRHPGLRQPRPAQPARLVQRPRLEGALPRRHEDPAAGPGPRATTCPLATWAINSRPG